jgi:hypothetical protein
MLAKRGRIAHHQQLAPCAAHAHVHAADVRQEADLALGLAARQGVGRDAALLALKRIDGAYWRKLKQRLNAEGGQTVTFCHGLKLAASDIRDQAKVYRQACIEKRLLPFESFFKRFALKLEFRRVF